MMLLHIDSIFIVIHYLLSRLNIGITFYIDAKLHFIVLVLILIFTSVMHRLPFFSNSVSVRDYVKKNTKIETLVTEAGKPDGMSDTTNPTKSTNNASSVQVQDMLIGGSGSATVWNGIPTQEYTVEARNVINCAGGAADVIARMIGDDSFKIKPRVGDYLLLKKKQVCKNCNHCCCCCLGDPVKLLKS